MIFHQDGIRVVDTARHRELIFDGEFETIQSSLEHHSLRSGLAYTDGLHLAAMSVPQVRSALFLGGGGCVVPKQFDAIYQSASIDVVEIDPLIAYIAKKYFEYYGPIINEDARSYVKKCSKHYDVVIVDVFEPDGQIPLDLKIPDELGTVVMHNRLGNSDFPCDHRFTVPGKPNVLSLTGGKLKMRPYNWRILPNLREIARTEHNGV